MAIFHCYVSSPEGIFANPTYGNRRWIRRPSPVFRQAPSYGRLLEELSTLGALLHRGAQVAAVREVHDQAQPARTDEDLS